MHSFVNQNSLIGPQ